MEEVTLPAQIVRVGWESHRIPDLPRTSRSPLLLLLLPLLLLLQPLLQPLLPPLWLLCRRSRTRR